MSSHSTLSKDLKFSVVIFVGLIILMMRIGYSEQAVSSPKPFPHVKRPFISSHRGSRFIAPENTLQGFKAMLALGSGVIEFDVRLTRDQKLVVYHDEFVNRTTDHQGPVSSFTVSELKNMKAAYNIKDQKGDFPFRNLEEIKISTLEEVFEEFWGKYPATLTSSDVNMNIEIKDNSMLVSNLLIDLLSKYENSHEHVLIVSNYCPPLENVQNKLPLVPTGTCEKEAMKFVIYHMLNDLFYPVVEIGKLLMKDSVKTQYSAFQLPISHMGMNFSTPYFVQDVHDLKSKEIHYWVVNTKQRMKQLLLLGVECLITDRTDLALEVWREMNLPLTSIWMEKYQDYLSYVIKPSDNFEEAHTCVDFICTVIGSIKPIVICVLILSLFICVRLMAYICGMMCPSKSAKLKVD